MLNVSSLFSLPSCFTAYRLHFSIRCIILQPNSSLKLDHNSNFYKKLAFQINATKLFPHPHLMHKSIPPINNHTTFSFCSYFSTQTFLQCPTDTTQNMVVAYLDDQ